jgi:hypothetical protein
MLLEAAAVLCLTNATSAAVFGQVRDDRFKTTSAKLEGNSLTYRGPLAEEPFPPVAPRQTDCITIDTEVLAKPHLVVWSGQPIVAADIAADRKGGATCRPTTPPQAGQRLTFVYRKSLFGQLSCKETR